MGEHVLVLLERREKTIKVRNESYGELPFWLPMEHVRLVTLPTGEPNSFIADVPPWLEKKHRQLAGDMAFENEKSKQRKKTMAFEQRPNSGSLFRNDKKTEDKHPDYKGSAQIDGVDMWISAWLKEGKNGQKFMSLSFKPKDEQKSAGKPANNRRDEDDGQIPF